MESFGEKLMPILKELEEVIWSQEARHPDIPHLFPDKAMFAASKIFLVVLTDKMWAKSERKDIPQKIRLEECTYVAQSLHALIKAATEIDLHNYK